MSVGVKTLEAAIRMANVTVEDGKNRVIIDRQQFSSGKRGRVSAVSVGSNELQNVRGEVVDEEPNDEAMYWKGKFEALQSAKDDEAEASKTKLAKMEQRVKFLEEKLSNNARNATRDDNRESVAKTNSFFETMTSMSVALGTEKDQYICTLRNQVKRTATRFEVRINPKSETDFQFTPMANIGMLPEYLQCEIFCESKMAPVLMGDMLQTLFEDSEEAEN